MTSPEQTIKPPAGEVGVQLRHWRDLRRKSQFALSLDTGVSQRHISFIESGRSSPSRQTLLVVAKALDVPLRDRNALLLAAGYAPVYSEVAWNAVEMKSVTRALERMLRQHEPFPAVVMDRYWTVLMANDSAPRFFNCFTDLTSRPKPRNILHLMFDPAGMRPFIANWDAVADSLLERVRRESVGGVIDEKTSALLAALLEYQYPAANSGSMLAAAPEVASVASPIPVMPVMPISFVKDGQVLNYFSMITTVGTPRTVAAQELRLECMFPADEVTEERHVLMMGRAT